MDISCPTRAETRAPSRAGMVGAPVGQRPSGSKINAGSGMVRGGISGDGTGGKAFQQYYG